MLVLSRKIGQSLVIGENIVIRVIRVRGRTVRLGIDAPDDVIVQRSELSEAAAFEPSTAEIGAKLAVEC